MIVLQPWHKVELQLIKYIRKQYYLQLIFSNNSLTLDFDNSTVFRNKLTCYVSHIILM